MLCCVFTSTRPLPGQTSYLHATKRTVSGLLIVRPEGKTASYDKPQVDFIIPHKDVFKCPLAALALAFAYAFDGKDRHENWDWNDSKTFRDEPLIWGNEVNANGEKKFQKYGASGFAAALKTMFANAGVDHGHVSHFARHTMPGKLADLGYVFFSSFSP